MSPLPLALAPSALRSVTLPVPLQPEPGTELVLAVVLGLLFALGTFLLLRRDLVRVVWGVAIISQAANVYLVTMGGIRGTVPVVGHSPPENPAAVTDPLVQALVLTAIVIGFGTTAFALVLTYRVYEEHGTIDLADFRRGSDEPASGASEPGTGPGATATDGGTSKPPGGALTPDDESLTADGSTPTPDGDGGDRQ